MTTSAVGLVVDEQDAGIAGLNVIIDDVSQALEVVLDSQTTNAQGGFGDSGLLLNRYLVEIEAPDGTWARREEVDVAKLPRTWAAVPAGRASVKIGSDWLASLRSPILMVPSVIVPEEWVPLINPAHPDASTIRAKAVRPFEYNRLFRS
jgi:RES domain-containing protein